MLAIVSAMPPELAALKALMPTDRITTVAGRRFHQGQLAGYEVVLALSGIGKVAAAATAAVLCQHFQASALLFTGVAGGLGAGVKVGDVVVADALLQHDLDVSPLFPRWVVPGSGRDRFAPDASWTARLRRASLAVLAQPEPELARGLAAFGLHRPQCHQGLIISGDRFVSTSAESQTLRSLLPEALAVEMEGAAVAQVCADFERPFAVLRTVSDRADDQAHLDFERFLAEVAADMARDIVMKALQNP